MYVFVGGNEQNYKCERLREGLSGMPITVPLNEKNSQALRDTKMKREPTKHISQMDWPFLGEPWDLV